VADLRILAQSGAETILSEAVVEKLEYQSGGAVGRADGDATAFAARDASMRS
jgi:hypothetical protein